MVDLITTAITADGCNVSTLTLKGTDPASSLVDDL